MSMCGLLRVIYGPKRYLKNGNGYFSLVSSEANLRVALDHLLCSTLSSFPERSCHKDDHYAIFNVISSFQKKAMLCLAGLSLPRGIGL